jgi:hypothetical protein
MSLIKKTVTAICWTICRGREGLDVLENHQPHHANAFIEYQLTKLPDYLVLPFNGLILFFSLCALFKHATLFHRLTYSKRHQILMRWRHSRLGFCRDFVRFFDALIIYDLGFSKKSGSEND